MAAGAKDPLSGGKHDPMQDITRQYSVCSAESTSSDEGGEEEVEQRQHWLVMNLQHYCGDTPGLFLFIPFMVTLTMVWAISHRLTSVFAVNDSPEDLLVMQQTKFIEVALPGGPCPVLSSPSGERSLAPWSGTVRPAPAGHRRCHST